MQLIAKFYGAGDKKKVRSSQPSAKGTEVANTLNAFPTSDDCGEERKTARITAATSNKIGNPIKKDGGETIPIHTANGKPPSHIRNA